MLCFFASLYYSITCPSLTRQSSKRRMLTYTIINPSACLMHMRAFKVQLRQLLIMGLRADRHIVCMDVCIRTPFTSNIAFVHVVVYMYLVTSIKILLTITLLHVHTVFACAFCTISSPSSRARRSIKICEFAHTRDALLHMCTPHTQTQNTTKNTFNSFRL